MLQGKKVIVVFPAYNAEKTLERTHKEIDFTIVDETILVDDASRDNTAELARRLGIHTIVHRKNKGYGGNQKTCYSEALARGADIVIMVHPDYQYSPRLIPAMASMIASNHFDIVLGSRILGKTALRGGMPYHKYIFNRFLTLAQNLLMAQKLSEYHSGYRAFSRAVLEALPIDQYDDDFIFDNQMLAQALYFRWRLGELSCPTRYFAEASSINFKRSCEYGLGVLGVSWRVFLARTGFGYSRLFPRNVPANMRGPGTAE
ncbi:glycosyltransferase family 2 protein [soil metagenome]